MYKALAENKISYTVLCKTKIKSSGEMEILICNEERDDHGHEGLVS